MTEKAISPLRRALRVARPLASSAALSLTLALALAPAARAGEAYEGRWDCTIGEFLFSAESFTADGAEMVILDSAREGNAHVLTFEDDFQIFLTLQENGTMEWYAPASGDSYLCRRLG